MMPNSALPNDQVVLPAPVAFVFTSGGGRAAAQVGMMAALIDAGIRPDLMVSSSFGSINAAAYAATPTGEHEQVSADLAELWQRIGSESAFASPGTTLARRLTVSRGGKTTRDMRDLMAHLVPDSPLESLPTRCIPVATDLATGNATSIAKGPALNATLASCAVPIFLRPIEIDGDLLIDGSLTQVAPVLPALAAGAKSIVLLDSGASTIPEDELAELRWWEVAATAYDHLMRGQVGHDLTRVAKHIPVVTLSTKYGNVFDFSDSDGMIREGRECADASLAGLGRVRDPGLYNVPVGYDTYPPFADLIRPGQQPRLEGALPRATTWAPPVPSTHATLKYRDAMTTNSGDSGVTPPREIRDLPDQLVDETGKPNFGIFRGIPELVDLSGLSEPYARNRMGQFLRHKRWMYIFAATTEVIIAGAVVDAGPSGTGFLMVTDRATGEVLADVSRPGGTRPMVRVGNKPLAGHESQYLFAGTDIKAQGDESELRFRAKFQKLPFVPLVSEPWIDLDLRLEHVAHHGITAISEVDHDPPMVTTTAKNAALPTNGQLKINQDGRKIHFDLSGGLGGFDFTSGYLPRETSWRWAFTTGTATDGRVMGLNLVSDFSGIGDRSLENVIWVDGISHRLDSAARIECDRDDLLKPWPIYTADGTVDLMFHPLTVHRESLNLGIVRSRFIQPSGHYTGTVRVGEDQLEIDGLPGVIEDQDVLW